MQVENFMQFIISILVLNPKGLKQQKYTNISLKMCFKFNLHFAFDEKYINT